jgi:RNA polymerase sigma factor (sigma-70 family)
MSCGRRQTAIEKNWRAVVIAEEETAGVDIQDPIDLTFRMEMNRVIEKLLVTVTPREEQVLRLRFGIAPHNQSYTLAEVGLMFEVSANRIRQIECHALRKMRHPDRAKKLKPFALDSGVCDLRTGKEKREDRTM